MSSTFDFTQCLKIIEANGKKLYHPDFKVIAEDYEIIFKLLVYFYQDKTNAEKYSISFRKGILLTGPVGCGKTSLMNLIRYFQHPDFRFIMKPCRDVSFEFIQDGYSVIHKYSKLSFKNDIPRTYCFDDLGTENNLKYYGNECNVMAEILLSRYDLYTSKKLLTHMTSNLNSSDIENLYGTRVRSRFREQFNLFSFSETAKYKRA